MIRRVATPAVGVVAVVSVLVLSLASGGGTLAGFVVLAALATAGLAIARARARTSGSHPAPVLERVGGCGLGPGVAVHAVRVADRVLVVGVTGSTIALLDTATVDELPAVRHSIQCGDDTPALPAMPSSSWLRRFGLAVVLAVGLVLSAGSAIAAQSESAQQSADLGASPRRERATPGSTPVPSENHLPLGPGPVLELPSSPDTPIGPMLWLAALAILPFALMGLTSFVKISVVLSLLRSALGTPQVPSDPLLAVIALALSTFVMAPVANEAWARVEASNVDLATAAGVVKAASAAAPPIRAFLERNARPDEVALFVSLSTREGREPADPGSFGILIPAFVTSELREAFVAGFFLFLPFLVVDLVVSNILMSMGMVMVSPTTVSLPFKILLFVLIDGWPLLAKALALSYH